nr:hypothetical protein [Tanacetum cinerariifolium]
VKENQKKDKIRSKPDNNGKRGKAKKSQKQLQSVEKEKLKKTQKEGPEMHNEGDDDDDQDKGNDDDQDTDEEGEEFIHTKLSIHGEEETKDEERFDPIIKTPENSDDEGNDDEILGLNVGSEEGQDAEDDEDKLYRDVNINLEERVIQMADVHTTQEFEDTHTTSQMDVPAPTTVASLTLFAPTLTPSTIPTISTVPQAPTPPTTAPSTLLQDLPNFGSLFGFDHRLKTLKANFFEFVQTNQFAGAVSSIPGIVQRYMDQRMNEAVKVAVQIQNGAKEDPNRENGKQQAIHRSDEQRNLYKALVKAYESNKIILDTYGDIVTLKRRCDDDADKDEEPSAGSDRGSKRRKEGKEPESTSAPKEKATRTTGKSTQGDLAKQADSRSSLYELMDTPVDFSAFLMNRLNVDTLTLKLLAGPTYELMKGSCKSLVELEFFQEEQSGNPTFSLHKEITSSKVTHKIHDSKGCNFLSEELPDIDSFNDIHLHFDDDPYSGSTTYSANSLLEEFTDELALITYPPDYDDNLTCDIESDIREIEFLLYHGDDSDLKDSIDQSDLANRDDLFVDPTHEMFTDEQSPDYSFPLRFDVYPNDFLERDLTSRISELAKQSDSRSFFNKLMDTPVDFSNFLMNRLNVDTLTPKILAGPTYELMKGSCKSLVELEFFLEEVYKATTDQLYWVNLEGQQYPHNLLKPLPLILNNRGRRVIQFDHFINNDLEYLRGGTLSHKYTTYVTKTKATDYKHIKWIEELVPRTIWIHKPIGYDKHALWGISHWGRKRQQFDGFAVNRESARDVYSKRRIIAVTELKIVEKADKSDGRRTLCFQRYSKNVHKKHRHPTACERSST